MAHGFGGQRNWRLPAFAERFAVRSIDGLAGLFLMREARGTDGRLEVVGYRARQVIAARFGVLAVITFVVVGVSVGVMLVDFQPEQLWWFVAAMLVLSVTYGLIGMLVGAVFN